MSKSLGGDTATHHTQAELEQQDADHWIQCDRCSKWRRVPQKVAEAIEDDAEWFVDISTPVAFIHDAAHSLHISLPVYVGCRYCDYNPNQALASCDVSQELTNEEIDQEAAEVWACV